MTGSNQTLLLSGSLLSNAATELAQTLRVDLLQLLDRPIANLSRYGISDACIGQLQSNGFVVVTDLNFLQMGHFRTMGFPENEVPLLTEICSEVRRTISVGSLSKILKNASENITEIAANLPIRNTFIDFPSLFPQDSRQPHSCPAFYFEEELEKAKTGASAVPAEGRPGVPSLGAAEHGTGACKPCAWFHHVEGCRHEAQCEFCHMCPAGEIKKRKKDKQRLIKTMTSNKNSGDDQVSTPDNEDYDDQEHFVNPTTHPTIQRAFEDTGKTPNWIGSIFAK